MGKLRTRTHFTADALDAVTCSSFAWGPWTGRVPLERCEPMKAGDAVWFRQTCRGGYGFQRDVPGEFIYVNGRDDDPDARVAIDVTTSLGERKRISVKAKNIRPRSCEAASPSPRQETPNG